MKTKIFPVLFAVTICVVLAVGCIPAGAYVGDVNPSAELELQPSYISFVDDSGGNIVSISNSPIVGDSTSEVAIYGDTDYFITASRTGAGYAYTLNDDTFSPVACSECRLTFPTFYFDPLASSHGTNPVGSNPYIVLPESLDYVSASWSALVRYYNDNGTQMFSRFSFDSGDLMSPAQLQIPISRLYEDYASLDYAIIEDLQCTIVSADASAYYISVTSSAGQFVSLRNASSYRPNEYITNVTEVTPNLLDWIITPLDSFLNIQIVPPDPSGDFGGATIGGILALVIAIPLLVAFLKVFAGG